MENDPFDSPAIHARIQAEILRIQSKRLEWIAEPSIGDPDTRAIEDLLATFEAYATAYLEVVDRENLVSDFVSRLRQVGSELIKNAECWKYSSNPYREERLRAIAESSGDYIVRKPSMTSAQQAEEIRGSVERLRIEYMGKALDWSIRTGHLLLRLEGLLEARYQHWAANAIEKIEKKSTAPTTERQSTTENRRESFVRPILETKGWSILDWAHESSVDFKTASHYLKGLTNPYRDTRKKLAKALGVPVENLPV